MVCVRVGTKRKGLQMPARSFYENLAVLEKRSRILGKKIYSIWGGIGFGLKEGEGGNVYLATGCDGERPVRFWGAGGE